MGIVNYFYFYCIADSVTVILFLRLDKAAMSIVIKSLTVIYPFLPLDILTYNYSKQTRS